MRRKLQARSADAPSSRKVRFANNDTARLGSPPLASERTSHTLSKSSARCRRGDCKLASQAVRAAPAVPRRAYGRSFRNRGEACGSCRSADRPTGRLERQSAGRCPVTPQRALWLALSLQPSPAADGVGWRSGGEGWRAT